MRGLILAAGRGRRCMPHTDGIPKLFVEVGGKTIFEHQMEAIEDYVDKVHVVLGYGFENDDGTLNEEKLEKYVDDTTRADFMLLPNWDNVENGETVRWAVEEIRDDIESSSWTTPTKDDIMIVCGDTIFRESLIQEATEVFYDMIEPNEKFNNSPYRQHRDSLAILINGKQNEETAGTIDEDGYLKDYGTMAGYRGTGVWIMNDSQWGAIRRILEENSSYWFSVAFPVVDTKVMLTDEEVYEINYKENVVDEYPL